LGCGDAFDRKSVLLALPPPDPGVLARFKWRLDDDFDTPGALAVIFGAIRDARAAPERAPALAAAVQACCEQALGLKLPFEDEALDEKVAELVVRRDAARARGGYSEADSIRAQLQDMGYIVEDGPKGTTVRRER
jgi:cysteinyl-tRNA synthetase